MLDPTTFAQHLVVLSETVKVTTPVHPYHLVTAGGGLTAGPNVPILGVATRAAQTGENVEVVSLGVVPVRVASGAAITPGTLLAADEDGFAAPAGPTHVAFGRARTAPQALVNPETGLPEHFVHAAIGFNLGFIPAS